MKKFLLLASFVLLAALPSAPAELVVLKGTSSSSAGTAATTDKQSQKAFFIYDRPNATGRVIFVSTKHKTVVDTGSRFYGFSQVKLGTKFYDYFVAATGNFTTNTNFAASQVYLKGAESTLFLLSPSTGPFTFPKNLSGLLTNISSNGNAGSSIATVATLVVGFDGATTRTANTSGQSSLQASQNIRGTFTAKGYTDLNPNVP